MILDSSAVVALLLQEPRYDVVEAKIAKASVIGIGLPTLVETTIVLSSRMGKDARSLLARFLEEASILTLPFENFHYSTAMDAWMRFGKGRHPAALNFGDCLAYATAKVAGQPLLCIGNDFQRTDLSLA